MPTVHVSRVIPAPPAAVFDLLADHAHYDRFRAVHGSELLRASTTDRQAQPPVEHHGGSIRLSPEGDATQVDWRSSFMVPTPLLGRLEKRIWAPVLARGFLRVLEDVERSLRST